MVVGDRILGRWFSLDGITFPPHSTYTYKTLEFNHTVIINSLGFRDCEFAENKNAKIRIVCIGDSFTFGWGVELSESWPKVLEANLRGESYDVEVLNLGQPGASPIEYERIAQKAIPLLHPDLVIVGILQIDDLQPTESQVS